MAMGVSRRCSEENHFRKVFKPPQPSFYSKIFFLEWPRVLNLEVSWSGQRKTFFEVAWQGRLRTPKNEVDFLLGTLPEESVSPSPPPSPAHWNHEKGKYLPTSRAVEQCQRTIGGGGGEGLSLPRKAANVTANSNSNRDKWTL